MRKRLLIPSILTFVAGALTFAPGELLAAGGSAMNGCGTGCTYGSCNISGILGCSCRCDGGRPICDCII